MYDLNAQQITPNKLCSVILKSTIFWIIGTVTIQTNVTDIISTGS